METPKLTVELVPKPCWFSNVRDHVSRAEWDRLRRATYREAHYICQVCGGRGSNWPVECHEIWHYDDRRYVQTLTGLIALCPSCHQVKHLYLAQLRGQFEVACAHLRQVNGWTATQTEQYLEQVWARWDERNRHDWHLDLHWLAHFGLQVTAKR
jgi:hypothetical protein